MCRSLRIVQTPGQGKRNYLLHKRQHSLDKQSNQLKRDFLPCIAPALSLSAVLQDRRYLYVNISATEPVVVQACRLRNVPYCKCCSTPKGP